jgi:hypothetical protein
MQVQSFCWRTFAAAKKLGLIIPPGLLAIADEVIE